MNNERYKAVPPKAKLKKLPKFVPNSRGNYICIQCKYIVASDHIHETSGTHKGDKEN